MIDFNTIFDQYCAEVPSREDAGHKLNQVREKYSEIVDAVGIDHRLLRINYADESRSVSECIATANLKTAYVFPEESAGFVVSLLKKHTSRDYCHIRRGDFDKASGKELKALVDGFVKMLYGLGYPISIVREQKEAMEKRLSLRSHLAMDVIKAECDKLIEQAMSYTGLTFSLNKEDQACFLNYVASSLSGLREYLSQVYSAYSYTRSEKLYEMAKAEAETLSMEDIEKDYRLSADIENDQELQRLVDERSKIIGEYGFVKNKRKKYAVVNERICQLLQEHHQTVYGEPVSKEEKMILNHPMNVLYEAITYVGEGLGEEYEHIELERLAKSKAQIEFEAAEAEELIKKIDERFAKRREGKNNDSGDNTES